MTNERDYPAGVSCWVDTGQPDMDAARHFYAVLFGWSFTDADAVAGCRQLELQRPAYR
jgi:predicted enzyme related to lactoylglutathione lyase